MNTPWIIGVFVAIAYFSYFEWRALAHPDRQNTLSRTIATLGARWPFSIFLMGFFVGVLSAHFFWSWSSNPLPGGG